MGLISQESATADLSTCDREPIHIPGQIQPFGVLLASPLDLTQIRYCSENTALVFQQSPAEILGKSCSAVLPDALCARLQSMREAVTAQTQRERIGIFDLPAGPAEVFYHRNPDDLLIIECELISERAIDVAPVDEIRQLLARVSTQKTLQSMLEEAVEGLQDLIGYDRVMAYQYARNGDGEVVAEARNPGVDSFLGLRYPAWDVPKQARALQIKSPLRMLSDVHQDPIPLLALDKSLPPLDMGLAHLRGISHIHVAYLDNMGVGATLTLGLVIDGQLWGMLSCHHLTPRLISSDLRIAAELFAQMLSLIVKQKQELENSARRSRAALARERIHFETDAKTDLVTSFDELAPILMEVVDCDGLALTYEDKVLSYQSTPSREAILAIAAQDAEQEHLIRMTDCLADSGLVDGMDCGVTAGALLIRATAAYPLQLIYFRDEIVQSLRWAGKPEKVMESGPLGPRISPRGSFAAYVENVRNHCESWVDSDLTAARELQMMLTQISARSDRAALQIHQELVTHHRQQELMIGELNHRVRNILALIRSVSRQAKSSAESLESYAVALERRISALAAAHDLAADNAMEGVSLRDLIRLESRPYLSDDGPSLHMEGPFVGLRTDVAPMLALVLHEVVTNAAKYGALSVPSGRVDVKWSNDNGWLDFSWQETGGPAVRPPSKLGFGSTLIERAVPFELDGEAGLEFKPEGVNFTFRVAEENLAELETEKEIDVIGKIGEIEKPVSGRVALLVEDNVMLAMDMMETLTRLGAKTVKTASSLEKGLKVAQADDFDFAVVDLNLRGVASFAIAEKLRARGIPMIFVTGYGSTLTRPAELEDVPLLTKPVDDAALGKTLQALLA